ncbi:MAG TPA: hypothetical protein VN031_01320 [Candidatus Microsaccharimonas sp.]|nr:hypothetical protein [Candidatus Microsaccharimonas sp.]
MNQDMNTSANSYTWGAPQEQLQPQQTAGGRLREAFANVDPAVKERAVQVATTIGREAALGSGLVKEGHDGDLRASKLGIAKTILNPTGALRRAARGGIRAGVGEAKGQARALAQEQVTNMAGNAFNQLPAPEAPAENWGTTAPAAESWGAMPQAPSANTYTWGEPTPAQAQELASSWNEPASTWATSQSAEWGAPIQQTTAAQMPPAVAQAPTFNVNPSDW